jgi:hypothetical protein
MEDEGEEHKKQVDQENIMLKNQSTISPTNDEEINILSQLHEDMLPISVTITNWLQFDYCIGPLRCPFLYDNGSLIHI